MVHTAIDKDFVVNLEANHARAIIVRSCIIILIIKSARNYDGIENAQKKISIKSQNLYI